MSSDPRFSRLKSDPRFHRPSSSSSSARKSIPDARFASAPDPLLKDKRGKAPSKSRENFVDRARGEGLSSSSDEEDEDEEDNSSADEGTIVFNQSDGSDIDLDESYPDPGLQASAEDEEQTIDPTKRVALVNLDWDNLSAQDLLQLVGSAAEVESVTVFPSAYGKERMKLESTVGPPSELMQDSEEGSQSLLRAYQLSRLRYFYAVVEFASVEESAKAVVYLQGAELERTANIIECKYIPDEVTWSEEEMSEIRDRATEKDESWQAREWSTSALRNSKVTLSWDQDDPLRENLTRKNLTREQIEAGDFSGLLASSDEGSDDEAEEIEKRKAKLRSILAESSEKIASSNKSQDEITFSSALTGAGAGAVDFPEHSESEEEKAVVKDETSREKYIRRQKEKKMARKAELEQGKRAADLPNDSERAGLSPDPFFERPKEQIKKSQAQSSKRLDKKARELLKAQKADKGAVSTSQELELLAEDNTGRDHFNIKDVVAAEKSKLKYGKKMEQGSAIQDNFNIDMKDPRFQAVFERSEYAIDPQHPSFKKTKSMSKMVDERMKRKGATQPSNETLSNVTKGEDWKSLSESVKRKSQTALNKTAKKSRQ